MTESRWGEPSPRSATDGASDATAPFVRRDDPGSYDREAGQGRAPGRSQDTDRAGDRRYQSGGSVDRGYGPDRPGVRGDAMGVRDRGYQPPERERVTGPNDRGHQPPDRGYRPDRPAVRGDATGMRDRGHQPPERDRMTGPNDRGHQPPDRGYETASGGHGHEPDEAFGRYYHRDQSYASGYEPDQRYDSGYEAGHDYDTGYGAGRRFDGGLESDWGNDSGYGPAGNLPASGSARQLQSGLPGSLGICIVIGAALLGAVATVLPGPAEHWRVAHEGLVLGACVLAGTAAGCFAVRRSAAYLLIPWPALAYLAAALIAGLIQDPAARASHSILLVDAAQWAATGFRAMTAATALAIVITIARWLLARNASNRPPGRVRPQATRSIPGTRRP